MTREEMTKELEKGIMYRKDIILRNLDMAIERLQKMKDESSSIENACDVLNFSRNLNDITGDISCQIDRNHKTLDELRLGLYYLNCVDELEK